MLCPSSQRAWELVSPGGLAALGRLKPRLIAGVVQGDGASLSEGAVQYRPGLQTVVACLQLCFLSPQRTGFLNPPLGQLFM